MRHNHSHEEPDLVERGAAVDRAHARPIQICVGRRRQGAPLLPVPEEKQYIRVDPGVRRGVCEAEGVLGQSTSIVQTKARYPTLPILRGHGEGDQFGPITGARLGAKTDLFRQQGVARARG